MTTFILIWRFIIQPGLILNAIVYCLIHDWGIWTLVFVVAFILVIVDLYNLILKAVHESNKEKEVKLDDE